MQGLAYRLLDADSAHQGFADDEEVVALESFDVPASAYAATQQAVPAL